MRFQYSGGSPQQQRWVQDAIAACSYPLADISATVTFQWATQMPSNADTRHPYMVTQIQSDGSFLVTVVSWADDPTNPNNQGLPDPSQDIYDFYKQSVVHELGHVVIDSTFNPGGTDTDLRIGSVCALFWRSSVDSGSGRKYGTTNDWDSGPLAWADEVREAVAEMFKCSFYQGRLIYRNRTNWSIDEPSWPSLLGFLTPPGTNTDFTSVGFAGGYSTVEWSQDPSTTQFNADGSIVVTNTATASNGLDTAGLTATPDGVAVPGKGFGSVSTLKVHGYSGTDWVDSRGVQAAVGLYYPTPNRALVVRFGAVPFGSSDNFVVGVIPPDPGGGDFAEATEPIVAPAFPWWLRMILADDGSTMTGELWTVPPDAGGSPFASETFDVSGLTGGLDEEAQPFIQLVVGFTLTLTLDLWTCTKDEAVAPPGGPFPPSPQGDITVTPGLRGAVRLAG